MADLRWTLGNTISGTLLITDPKGWEEIVLEIRRSEEWHGLFDSFSEREFEFTCQLPNGDEGGKEYIDNIYETQGIDALVTLLIEYDCDGDGTFVTLFNGKLVLSTYKTGLNDRVGETTKVMIEEDSISKTIRDRKDIKINLNSLTSLDGSALTAYVNAPRAVAISSQQIDLDSEIDGGVNVVSTVFTMQTTFNHNFFMQHPMPIIQDDLQTTMANPTYSQQAAGLAIDRTSMIATNEATENKIIQYPETYVISWDFTGVWNDCAAVASTRAVVSVTLNLAYGESLENPQFVTIGTLATGGTYPVGTICPAQASIPFAFVGGTSITLNQNDKIWLYWFVNQYVIVAGPAQPAPVVVTLRIDYLTEELKMHVDSSKVVPDNSGFAIYEVGARIAESITDQTTYAFKSDFFGRPDSQPTGGGAPVYFVDGCGALNYIFSGLALRFYGYLGKFATLPDYTTLNEFFKAGDAVFNLCLTVEDHSGQDVIRVEEKDYCYDQTSIIQLDNVNEISKAASEKHFITEFNVGYEQWQPEALDGMDEICTKHQYHTPLTAVQNTLNAESPYLASGYAIEIIKRTIDNQKKDHKYDNNMFWVAMRRFGGTFISDNNADFSATSGFDNPSTRYNIKLTPKRAMLRWLNVLGGSIEKIPGQKIDFTYGEGNYDITSTIGAVAYRNCPGSYKTFLLDEDGDIAWDDGNAHHDTPLWIPEIYEFDHPLTFTEWVTIRNAPRGFIEFREDSSSAFIGGFILELKFNLAGGMTHFKLLRRYTT